MNQYRVVTCCNRIPSEPYYVLPQYFRSLQGEEPIVLTEDFGGRWGGLASKPKWLYKAITEKYIDTPYIIFTDCWDLLFSVKPQDVFDMYMEYTEGSCILISTEKNCFPDTFKKEFDEVADLVDNSTEYRYINSGFIIGKTSDILKCLEAMDLPNLPDDHFDGEKNVHPNDQFEWQKIWATLDTVDFYLDYLQQFSATLHETTPDQLDFTEDKIKLKSTGSYPLTWHMNGNGKTSGCREAILKHLNLLT